MKNKKIICSITVASIISTGLFSACGNVADTDGESESSNEAVSVSEENAKEENVTEETSFGLQDYEGFYCMTATEEIEGYEVTYTHGYLLNGDGTGVAYGQDTVEITWNETEIHYADSTVNYTMEPGKLTVNDVTYDKISGKFIAPDPVKVDTDNIPNGIYYVEIDKSGISEDDGKITAWTTIYTEDSYDIVDINKMAEGDVIYINGRLLPVTSVEETSWGVLNINGGIENLGSAVVAVDESNCYVYAGMDMERSYTRQGVTTLIISEDVTLVDNSDPTVTKGYAGNDAISALMEMLESNYLSCYDCSVVVEDGAIVAINRNYRP